MQVTQPTNKYWMESSNKMYFGSNIWRCPLTMLTFIFECHNARLAKKTQTWNIQMQQLNQQWSHEKAYLCTWVYVLLFTCGSIAFEPFIYFWKCGSSWHLCNNVQIQNYYHSSFDTSVPSQYGQKCRGQSLWWHGQKADCEDHQPRCSGTCWEDFSHLKAKTHLSLIVLVRGSLFSSSLPLILSNRLPPPCFEFFNFLSQLVSHKLNSVFPSPGISIHGTS